MAFSNTLHTESILILYLIFLWFVFCWSILSFFLAFLGIIYSTSECLFLNFTQGWTHFNQMQWKFAVEVRELLKHLLHKTKVMFPCNAMVNFPLAYLISALVQCLSMHTETGSVFHLAKLFGWKFGNFPCQMERLFSILFKLANLIGWSKNVQVCDGAVMVQDDQKLENGNSW